MARVVRAWPCLASAALLCLAFPPFNLGLIAFVALAPWLVSLQGISGKAGFRSGWTFGFLFLLGQFLFLFSFVSRWTGSVGLALVPYLLASAIGGLYFGLAGGLISRCWEKRAIWAIPLVWAGVEVFRSYLPGLAFPYGLIGIPLWTFPQVIQTAFYGSVFFVSAWVVLANVVAALYLARQGPWSTIRNYVGIFVLVLVASLVRYQAPVSAVTKAVTIGQPGTDLAFGNREANDARLRTAVPEFFAAARARGSSLLVLPEGISGNDGAFPPHPVFSVDGKVPVLFGGQRQDGGQHQTAFGFDGKWSYADKTRLVIFGEYVPLREQLPFLASAFQIPGGDLVPGDSVQSLSLGELKVGPVLCFEALFPNVSYQQARNGAQLLAVMSVDDWYMGTAAPEYLKVNSIWRAVETGLPVVRAASQGYSLAVGPRGDVLAAIPLGECRAVTVGVPVADGAPFAGFYAFPALALLSLVVLPVWWRVLRR